MKTIKPDLNYFILLIIVTLSFFSCDQQENSTSRVLIKGTHVSIIPPPGYTLSSTFVGVEKGMESGIEVYDFSGSYEVMGFNYQEEQFERRGIKVISNENVRIDGYSGRLMHFVMDEKLNGYCIVFGDSSFCSVVVGNYIGLKKELGNEIKESLLTTRYNKSIRLPGAEQPKAFSLDDKQSKFKLAKSSSGAYLYSLNGLAKADYGFEPYVQVHLVPFDPSANTDRIANIIIDGLEGAGFTNVSIKNESRAEINTYNACEFEAHCMARESKCIIYNLVIIDRGKIITVQGGCYEDFEENIAEFKKLTHTIKIAD